MYHRLIRFLLRHGWGESDPDDEELRVVAWFFVPLMAVFLAAILWVGGIEGW